MRGAEFKSWLEAQSFAASSIGTRLSDAKRVEAHYGDLDQAFELDRCQSLLAGMAYSKADEARGLENPTVISIVGNIYNSLASYRSGVATYCRFRDASGLAPAKVASLAAEHVHAAMDECDELGVDRFLMTYGFGQPRDYWVLRDGVRYPSKAIIGVAHKFVDGGRALGPKDLSGGVAPGSAAATLTQLGFEIVGLDEGVREAPVWFVTARNGEKDGLRGFVQRGEWSLLYEGRYSDKVREMRPGDRIVMRDYTPRSSNPPFETKGVPVSSMLIRATGTVRENRDDGLSVAVDWEELDEPRTWFFYTSNDTVWRLPDEEYARKLTAFTFDGDAQDYAWWLAQPYWRNRIAGRLLSEEYHMMPSTPHNLILYGPPGTGKTFATAHEAVRLCTGEAIADRDALMAEYRRLESENRIRFVTFHQSFSYEEFVEGLRPEIGEDEAGQGTGFRLETKLGIFREICALAEQARTRKAGGLGTADFDFAGRKFWKMGLGAIGSEDSVYEAAIAGEYIVLGWGGDVDWSDARFDDIEAVRKEWSAAPRESDFPSNVTQLWPYRTVMKRGDIIIVPFGNSAFRAVGEVIGDYEYAPTGEATFNHRRAVRWLLVLDEPLPLDTIIDGKFTMRTFYSIADNRVNKPALARLLAGRDVPSDSVVEERAGGDIDQFVLVIDEINRANISKVFGELITLIEADKRLGMRNALTARLPYSKREFGVPANLHIIGTMNTADRSIALLDTALRRRFEFRELMPQPELLDRVDGIDLTAMLRTINARIEYLFDREHQIGHAYLIGCSDKAAIDAAMRHRIIPLLAEYFYEDWHKVALVLGDTEGQGGFLRREALKAPPGLDPANEGAERFRWTVASDFPHDAYSRLAAV